MFKKMFSLFMVLTILTGVTITVDATSLSTIWKVYDKDIAVGTSYSGTWNYFHESYPCGADGEYLSIGYSTTTSNEISASASAAITDAVELSLGYSYGKSITFSGTVNTRQLKKGEYVKAYWREVHQIDNLYMRPYDQFAGKWIGNEFTFVQSFKALMPQIRLDYYKNGVKLSYKQPFDMSESKIVDMEQTPTESQYFELVDGEMKLVKTVKY